MCVCVARSSFGSGKRFFFVRKEQIQKLSLDANSVAHRFSGMIELNVNIVTNCSDINTIISYVERFRWYVIREACAHTLDRKTEPDQSHCIYDGEKSTR